MHWVEAVRRSVAACVALAAPLTAAVPSAAPDAQLASTVDDYVQPLVDLGVFQGTVLVARGEELLVEKVYGFANVELGVPNKPEQVFRIASLSKAFTQLALAKLAEEGQLGLDDPLSRFLPDYPQADQIGRASCRERV